MAASIGEQRGRRDALPDRRLDVQVKLAQEPGDGKPAVALDGDTGMRTQAALAPGHRQTFGVKLRPRRLRSIPGFA